MPEITLIKDIKVDNDSFERLFEQTVFDFYGGIICDDMKRCLNDYSEYVAISLTIKNVGKEEINGIIIDFVYVCLESKSECELKLSQGDVINKALSEGNIDCWKKFTLLPGESREVTLLFACEELGWLDINGLIDAAQEGHVLIEMNMRLFSINNSVYKQKALIEEYKDGKLNECSRGSISVYEDK